MLKARRRDRTPIGGPNRLIATRLFAAVRGFCKSLGMTASAIDEAYERAIHEPPRSGSNIDDWGDQGMLTRLSEMLHIWHTAPDYVDTNGAPKPLPIHGDKSLASLATLVGAPRPRRLVETAVSLGILVRGPSDGRFKPICRSAILGGRTQLAFAYSAVVVGRLLDALAHNVIEAKPGVPAWFERTVERAHVRSRDLPLFERFISEQGQYFVDAIDDWLAHHSVDRGAPSSTYVGVSAFAWMRPTRRRRAADAIRATSGDLPM